MNILLKTFFERWIAAPVAQALCVIAIAFTCFAAPAKAASPPAIDLYGTLPKTEALKISPSGELYAKVFTEGEKRLVGAFKIDGTPIFGSELADMEFSHLDWAGDDYLLVYTTTVASLVIRHDATYLQGFVLDLKEMSARPLLPESVNYFAALFGSYGVGREEDGNWYAYAGVVPLDKQRDMKSSTFRQPFPNLSKIDLKTGRVTVVTSGAPSRRWVIDNKGAVVARSEYDDQDRSWRILPPDSTKPIATGVSDYGFRMLGLGRTPGTVIVRSIRPALRLTEIKLDGSGQEEILPADVSLIYSPYSRLLVGTRPPRASEAVIYDPTLAPRVASIRRAFKNATISLSSFSADMSKIVAYVQASDVPGAWQLVDFKSGQANPLAEDYPGIPSDMIGSARMYRYRAMDGLEMEGVLTLPPGSDGRNLPVVVMEHRPDYWNETGVFDPWVQVFASRGYAVFQPNARGAEGYGDEFRNAGYGEWGRKMQTDISDGLAALAVEGIVDLKRVCIVGISYGGYAALAGVTMQQGIYRCAISLDGVSDPAEMLLQDARDGASKASRRFWTSYIGDVRPSDISKDISPRALAERADAPILLGHTKKDSDVSLDQSRDMVTALQRAGKHVEYIELEDRGLLRSATRLQWFKAMVEFVQKHNPA